MMRELFDRIISAASEAEVAQVVGSSLQRLSSSWVPLGGNENNFGVIENQQSSPIAALIEKITNSIDAILMRRCTENGIDPRSAAAPPNNGGRDCVFLWRGCEELAPWRHPTKAVGDDSNTRQWFKAAPMPSDL